MVISKSIVFLWGMGVTLVVSVWVVVFSPGVKVYFLVK